LVSSRNGKRKLRKRALGQLMPITRLGRVSRTILRNSKYLEI